MPVYRYRMRYGSFRALDADHAAYLVHGGAVLPLSGADAAPANETVLLRLEGPDGTFFVLEARSGQAIPGQGFMVSFEEPSRSVRDRLDEYVQSEGFQSSKQDEPSDPMKAPEVSRVDAFEAPSEEADLGLEDALPPMEDDDAVPAEAAAPEPPKEPAPSSSAPPRTVAAPGPGQSYVLYAVKFDRVTEFAEMRDRFRDELRFDVAVEDPDVHPGDKARLRLTLPGHNQFEMWAVVDDVAPTRIRLQLPEDDEQHRRALVYVDSVSARSRLEREIDEPGAAPAVFRLDAKVPEEDISKMPIRRRLARMGMDEKINLALTGNREERMALATDGNKAVHHYLLKNTKITIDEIAFMARLPSLNPDVLDKIAENPRYTQNTTISKALVFNPRTPVPTAIRMLDRLPRPDLLVLSKRTSLNPRLVQAVKKKVTGSDV